MADVEQTKLGDLFPRAVFRIPRYQRGYSWSRTQVNDLLEDLRYTYEEREINSRNDFSHYFGTIVLHDTGYTDGETRNFESYDIIDGQQRLTTVAILMSCINEELRSVEGDTLLDDHSVSPDQVIDANRSEFISKHGTERIELDSLNKRTYQMLVVHDNDLSKVPSNNISQRRLIDAKKTMQRWLENYREQYEADSGGADEYYDFLRKFGKTVKNGLEVTTYTIEDEAEAGRLFEIVNDRGKDLTTLDKIKSYLVYCAARRDDRELSREIYTKIGEVIENITENGGTDQDIESFVNHHWKLFSGEITRAKQRNTEYTKIHRRIKHLEKHAATNQSRRSHEKWVEAYLASITHSSEVYSKIENPELINTSECEYGEKIVEKFDGLMQLPASSNFLPLLMAVYREFGLSRELYTVADLCETISIRVYNVGNRRVDAARALLHRHAYWIEWAGQADEAEEIFSSKQNTLKFNDRKEALEETCRMIESQIGNHCPDSFFVKNLLRDDIFDGSNSNDGWTGVRNKNVARYILYKYEKHLRVEGSKSNISQIPRFSQWRNEGITIEHIFPQNPDSLPEDSSIEEVTDALGNLVLLGPEDNSGASNESYQEKYNEIYSNSSMNAIDELPSGEEGWTKEDIDERTRDIAQFALAKWGGLSKAHIHAESVPEGVSEDDLIEIARDVRDHYRNETGLDLPSVHIQEEGVPTNEEWEIINKCPSCDGTRVNIESVDGWNATCGGCGQTLDEPVYKVNVNDYSGQSKIEEYAKNV